MKLAEMIQSEKTMLSPQDVAEVLCCDPQLLRVQARQCPERLPFPFILVGNRMKIPRLAFLRVMGVNVQ